MLFICHKRLQEKWECSFFRKLYQFFFLVFRHGDSKGFMRISPRNHRPHTQEPPRRQISAGRAPLGVSRVCRPRVLLYHPPGAVAPRKPLSLWIQEAPQGWTQAPRRRQRRRSHLFPCFSTGTKLHWPSSRSNNRPSIVPKKQHQTASEHQTNKTIASC